jgi:hypothetical protein
MTAPATATTNACCQEVSPITAPQHAIRGGNVIASSTLFARVIGPKHLRVS